MANPGRIRQQLEEFFEDLKRHGPKRSMGVNFMPSAGLEEPDEEGERHHDIPTSPLYPIETPEDIPDVVPFLRRSPDERCPIAAVDASVMRLGESADGLVIALRGAIVVRDGARSMTGLVRSGPIFLAWEHEAELLLTLGQWLGDPGYYVVAERSASGGYQAGKLKDGVGGRKYLADRFRAGLERYCQRLAAASIKNGTLLLDGSLTLRSRDTPDAFLNQIAYLAGRDGSSIIGISKKSELVVGGRAVSYWLDDKLQVACHRPLTPILQWEDAQADSEHGGRADRVLGSVHAARLSPFGPTFRMDVKCAPGITDAEAIRRFYQSADIYCGYPSLLAQAHAACYISSADYLALQVQAAREFSLRPKRQAVSLKGAFAPFGGTFK